jgi:hypothetical protein
MSPDSLAPPARLGRSSHWGDGPVDNPKTAAVFNAGKACRLDELRARRRQEYLPLLLAQRTKERRSPLSVQLTRHVVQEQNGPDSARVADHLDLAQFQRKHY